MKGLKLVQVGGGSSYSPDIAEILVHMRDELPVAEWVLYDIDERRMEIVGAFCSKMLEIAGVATVVTLSTDLRASLTGADYVLATIRVGGADGRIIDETVPFKYDTLLGQETTTPGGLLMGLRQIPPLLEVAHIMEEVSSAGAYLVNLSNPAGMLSEALSRHSSVKFAGLCNGPTVLRNAMSDIYRPADPKDLFVKILGLNHLVFGKVYIKGEDVTEDAADRLMEWYGKNVPPMRTESAPTYIARFSGWIPMGPYLRYYYQLPAAIADMRDQRDKWPKLFEYIKKTVGGGILDGLSAADLPTRAHMVKAVERVTLDLYAKGDMDGYKLAANSRGGKGYGEAGMSLISAIHNNKGEIHSPDVRNGGTIEGLARDEVATVTAVVNGLGILPLAFDPLPPHIQSFIKSAKIYEILAVEAAVSGDYHAALEALVANPLIVSYDSAKAALDELLVAHKAYLPAFADAIGRLERKEDPAAPRARKRVAPC